MRIRQRSPVSAFITGTAQFLESRVVSRVPHKHNYLSIAGFTNDLDWKIYLSSVMIYISVSEL